MTFGMKICRVLLWILVILFGIEMGAGLFELLVLVPRWAASPPESVWRLHELNQQFPEFATNAGDRFWILATPLLGLLAMALLAACFTTRGAHRSWILTSTIVTIALVVATLVYFVPSIMAFGGSPRGVNGAQISAMAHRWVALTWVRFFFYLAAWLCALRALALQPMPPPT
jgi:hypothetical protein